jgi:hypothetical protein
MKVLSSLVVVLVGQWTVLPVRAQDHGKEASPEKIIVGKWKIDIEESRKLCPDSEKPNFEKAVPLLESVTFEFKADNTFQFSKKDDSISGKWKLLSSTANTATIEIHEGKAGKGQPIVFTFTVVNQDRIRMLEKGDKKDKGTADKQIVLKRA